jgi:mannose-6-phosphate isomerase-like protein (cupin superfamily)
LADVLAKTGYFDPQVVARVNACEVKVTRIVGDFIWHRHHSTDEAFIVLTGDLSIHLRDRIVHLAAGDLFVVPRGVEHKSSSKTECEVIMIEATGTANTGDE